MGRKPYRLAAITSNPYLSLSLLTTAEGKRLGRGDLQHVIEFRREKILLDKLKSVTGIDGDSIIYGFERQIKFEPNGISPSLQKDCLRIENKSPPRRT